MGSKSCSSYLFQPGAVLQEFNLCSAIQLLWEETNYIGVYFMHGLGGGPVIHCSTGNWQKSWPTSIILD